MSTPLPTRLTAEQQSELLGQMLIRKRKLDAVELEYVRQKQAAGGGLLRTILAQEGLVSEQEIEDCTAYWIQIAGEQHFLGCTLEAANLTAEQGDWIRLGLNGRLLPDDFAWFEQRAKLGSDWLSKETSTVSRSFRQTPRSTMSPATIASSAAATMPIPGR